MFKKIAKIAAAAFLMAAMFTTTASAAGLPYKFAAEGETNGFVAGDGYVQYLQDGVPATGWVVIDDGYYHFDDEGKMQIGWIDVNGFKYYLTEVEVEGHRFGTAYIGCETPDGNMVGENGAKIGKANPYHHSCIEVDITNQTVYAYIDETLVVETPTVTGRKGAHDTSVGNWVINSKQTNRYLDGYNDNGTKYHSYVNYWMPFHNGEGLHDASWRSAFGGNIYASNGSHGCVNLPRAAAAAIYNIAYVGMPVYVHY